MNNLIDIIGKNQFLKSLFPQEIDASVLLSDIHLSRYGRSSLNIHTRHPPAKNIKKWGKWGEDYNTIVITLGGIRVYDLEFKNWEGIGYLPLQIAIEHDVYLISQSSNEGFIKFSADCFIFQSASTYFDDP